MVQFLVFGEDHPAFHGRDVVREEETEGVYRAESAGFAVCKLGVHRLAVVLEQIEAVPVAQFG